MKILKQSIKSLDYFGQPIALNFGKGRTVHNTLLGGIFSLLINVGMMIMILKLVLEIVSY